MGQWQHDFEDTACLFQWSLVSLKEFIEFAFNAPVVLKIFQRLYIQECGKELGSLGCHCHGEALFGSLQVFKSNLFGLCLLSNHLTVAQDFGADFGVCLLTGYQFQWGIFERLKRLLRQVSQAYTIISYPCKVQSAFEQLTFQICASKGRQSGGRRMPRSQTVVFSF